MDATQQNQSEVEDYNVRLVGPRLIKKALRQEQNRRYQETGEITPVMRIATEWLIEKSQHVLKAQVGA